jgi:periplasmic protein TonB
MEGRVALLQAYPRRHEVRSTQRDHRTLGSIFSVPRLQVSQSGETQEREAANSMYSPRRNRTVSAFGAALLVAALGALLMSGLAARVPALMRDSITLVSLDPREPPRQPKPPPERPKPRAVQSTDTGARPAKGAPSSPNLRNRATQVVAPKLEPLILPPPIVAATQAGTGSAANTGASDRLGPGQGAGGFGSGFGGGGDGEGGDNGGDVPPRQIKGRLRFSDLPAGLQESERGGWVSVRYAVNIDGRVSDCRVTESSGSAELDWVTCALIERRFRFDPSRDGRGRPVRSIIVETHSWTIEPSEEEYGGR